MDIGLARTFLAICETGNFVKAADQLNVTQSTVSSRVKLLEDLLRQQLFIRTKAGATMTIAGIQFKPYAEKMVQTWEQARHDVGLPEHFSRVFTIGSEFVLWERLLVNWIPWIRTSVPDLAVSADIGAPDYLMRQLSNGMLDLVVTYTPQHRTGLVIENLMEESLVLVSTDPAAIEPLGAGYVYVDWGPAFKTHHMEAFPACGPPILSVGYGPLALQLILANGGAAYLPLRLIRPLLEDRQLHLIRSAPAFPRPIFTVHLDGEDSERFKTAMQGLRYVASMESEAGQGSFS
ncbi:MAG: LysR family transcriptional regulator [Rhodospirillales bacterium]|nr:LysR family transcriptional regulator [Rhodospirillales bacterium]